MFLKKKTMCPICLCVKKKNVLLFISCSLLKNTEGLLFFCSDSISMVAFSRFMFA